MLYEVQEGKEGCSGVSGEEVKGGINFFKAFFREGIRGGDFDIVISEY